MRPHNAKLVVARSSGVVCVAGQKLALGALDDCALRALLKLPWRLARVYAEPLCLLTRLRSQVGVEAEVNSWHLPCVVGTEEMCSPTKVFP